MSTEPGTAAPSAAQVKTERLLNLVLVLLYIFRADLGFGHGTNISVPNKIDVNVNH